MARSLIQKSGEIQDLVNVSIRNNQESIQNIPNHKISTSNKIIEIFLTIINKQNELLGYDLIGFEPSLSVNFSAFSLCENNDVYTEIINSRRCC